MGFADGAWSIFVDGFGDEQTAAIDAHGEAHLGSAIDVEFAEVVRDQNGHGTGATFVGDVEADQAAAVGGPLQSLFDGAADVIDVAAQAQAVLRVVADVKTGGGIFRTAGQQVAGNDFEHQKGGDQKSGHCGGDADNLSGTDAAFFGS